VSVDIGRNQTLRITQPIKPFVDTIYIYTHFDYAKLTK